MEHENYASKGQANLNTVLGTIGTVGATGFLNGGLGNILGGRNCTCSEDHYVNRYEAAQSARIAELETEVKLRDSNIYTDSKILELYKYVDSKFGAVEAELCQQRVYNATCNATLNCVNAQVAELMALTSRVIPKSSICPSVMPEFNSWTAPTAPAAGA